MQNLSSRISQKVILCIFICIFPFVCYAEKWADNSLDIIYEDKQYIEKQQNLDVSLLARDLKQEFPESSISLEWDIVGQASQSGESALLEFSTAGVKSFSLNIYKKDQSEEVRTLLRTIDGEIFVYTHAIPLFAEEYENEEKHDKFINSAKELWIYIRPISLETPYDLIQENTNFNIIWWSKEYIFWTLSQLWAEQSTWNNFVLISSHNPRILEGFITNSISGNSIIHEAFIIDESIKRQILNSPENILKLKNQLIANDYTPTSVNADEYIAPWFFLSQFINTLSNNGVSPDDLYIILMIPFLLTFVVILKHLVGFSSFGTIIPVFLTLLCIKFGIIFTVILCISLFCINTSIGFFLKNYTLLYMPKVVSILLINFIAFILLYNLTEYTAIPTPHIKEIFYVFIFYLTAEKMIHIMVTKEFREYKKSFLWTFVIALIGYIIYDFEIFQTFFLAYPELLLLLVPFNIYLGRFTGLRITEYLRFRDVYKSIEE